MRKLTQLYRNSRWYETFNLSTDGGKARTALLATQIPQAIVNGFTTGSFYAGLLLGHGINIVNISILTLIPYLASLLTIFTPYILDRFPKRRFIVSAARVLYYLIKIIGITLLPQLVHDETARIWGLIAIVFSADAIRFLFEGYNPWHVPYIVPEVRNNYFTATTLVSNISSSLVMITASAMVDALEGDAQLAMITTMRYISFGIAMLDVYLLQVPKEPDYGVQKRPALLDVFRRPLADKGFRMTILLLTGYHFLANLSSAALDAWLLNEVGVSYTYMYVISSLFFLFVIFTSPFWNMMQHKIGRSRSYALALGVDAISIIAYGFVNSRNYLWLLTLVRLTQHFISMGITFGGNGLLYDTLPLKNQTAHLSLHTLTSNLGVFLGMSTGTAIVAAIGDNSISFLGCTLTAVPVVRIIQGILLCVLALYNCRLRKRLDIKRSATPSSQ